ncbi:MAG: cation:proton antiporter [bacterium]|nr:cation:proton antiporter [bacterium]
MTFFNDLGIVIVVVAMVALVFSRFKLPLTVGYILAGVIVGPNFGPKLITSPANIEMLSDLGVMFLMFSIGLGFSFKQLRVQGFAVVFPAIWDVLLMVAGGFLMGSLLGWTHMECFLLGLIICNSSTSIAAKTLEELGLLKERFASNAFAIAVIEDILSILLIAILYSVGSADHAGAWTDTVLAIAKQMGILLLFLIGVIVLGLLAIPPLMNRVAVRFGNEIVLMTALGFCFGVSLLADALKLSIVVGAFLAGTILSYVNARERLVRTVKPVSQLFAAVFFVTVGLLVQPMVIWDNILTVLLITFSMIVLKCINGVVAALLVGERPTDAFRTGLALGQIAEFAFIIAAVGATLNMTDRPLFQISVGVALLCTATNPYLLRFAPTICKRLRKGMPKGLRHALMTYRTTIENMRNRNRQTGRGAVLRMDFFLLLVDVCLAIIFALIIYIISTIPMIERFLQGIEHSLQPLPWTIPWGGLICVGGLMVLAVIPLWAAYHHLTHIANELAAATVDIFPSKRENKRIRRLIRNFLRVLSAFGIGTFMLVLSTPFVANVWILIPFIVLCVLIASRFSHRLKSTTAHHQNKLRQAFDIEEAEDEAPIDRQSVHQMIDFHTEILILAKTSRCCGKTLAEIDLRRKTGAALISIYSKAFDTQIAPGGDTRLQAGDCIVVCGTDEQIAHAMNLFNERVR